MDPTFRAGPFHWLWMHGSMCWLPPHLLGKVSCAAAQVRTRLSRHPNPLPQTPGRTGLLNMFSMGWPVCLRKKHMIRTPCSHWQFSAWVAENCVPTRLSVHGSFCLGRLRWEYIMLHFWHVVIVHFNLGYHCSNHAQWMSLVAQGILVL